MQREIENADRAFVWFCVAAIIVATLIITGLRIIFGT